LLNRISIQDDFASAGVVTFKEGMQSPGTLDERVSGDSLSGLYFNRGTHPFLENFDNLKAMANDTTGWTVQAWDNAVTYSKQDIVEDAASSGNYFQSLTNANSGNTTSNTTNWLPTTLLSQYLNEYTRGALDTILSTQFEVNPLVDAKQLMKIGKLDETVPIEAKWRGLRITPKSSDYLNIRFNQIGLRFTGAQAVTIKLYNQNTPKLSETFNITSNNFEWSTPTTDWLIDNEPGSWYVFYDETNHTEQSIGTNAYLQKCFYKYFDVIAFEAPVGTDLNTLDESSFRWDTNFGINLNFTIGYDLTEFVIENKRSFKEVWQLQAAFDLLTSMKVNAGIRSNRNQRAINIEEHIDEINFQLVDLTNYTLAKRLESAYKKLKAALNRIAQTDSALRVNKGNWYEVTTM